jgi:hypothetical protein
MLLTDLMIISARLRLIQRSGAGEITAMGNSDLELGRPGHLQRRYKRFLVKSGALAQQEQTLPVQSS